MIETQSKDPAEPRSVAFIKRTSRNLFSPAKSPLMSTSKTADELLSTIFKTKNPLEALQTLTVIASGDEIKLQPQYIHLLTALYIDSFCSDPELRTAASDFLGVYFYSTTQENLNLFVDSGLLQLVLPQFPDYHIPRFLGVLAYSSYAAALKMVEFGLPEKLISMLNEDMEDLPFIITIIGSIGCFSQFSEKMVDAVPIIIDFATSSPVEKIVVESVSTLGLLVEASPKICKMFLDNPKSETIISFIHSETPLLRDASIMLYAGILSNPDCIDQKMINSCLQSILPFYFGTDVFTLRMCLDLLISATKCGTMFVDCCIDRDILLYAFTLMKGDIDWKTKSGAFRVIFSLLSKSSYQQIPVFVEYGLLELIEKFIVPMSELCGRPIVDGLSNIVSLCDSDSELRQSIVSCDDVYTALDSLLKSGDIEISYRAKAILSALE